MPSFEQKQNKQLTDPFFAQAPAWQQPAPQYYAFPENSRAPLSQQPLQQRRPAGQQRPVPAMPKAQALNLVESLKRWIVVASIVSFGLLTALVLGNMPKTTTSPSQANPATSPANSSNSSGPSSPSSPSGPGGFFQQQQGGYGFGSNGSDQGPVSHSSAS